MEVLNYILGLVGFPLVYERNELKYVWMNEADSVFANEDSLIKVPYVESSFLGNLNVKFMIPWHMNKWYEQLYVLYELWYVLCVRCSVLYAKC